MNFKEWLYSEVSYTPEQIPKEFFLGLRWNPAQLAERRLTGVQGITADMSTAKIHERGALLIMDGPQTEKMNQISKIMYEKPEYLASKGMSAVGRIMGYTPGPSAREVMIYRACTKIFAPFSDPGDIAQEIYREFPVTKKLSQFLKEFWNRLQPHLKKPKSIEDVTWERFKGIVVEELARLGRVYASESEWRVKDNTLNIPKGSKLLLKDPTLDWENQVIHYGLENEYEIISAHPTDSGKWHTPAKYQNLLNKYK
jgi:hypothetical protein